MARPMREVLEDPEVVRHLQQHPASFKFKEGASLVVTALKRPPHIALLEEDDGSLSITGPVGTLIDTIAQSLNFTYRVVTPPDRTWGYELPNGSWSGMLGQVVRQEADISLGPFAMSLSRNKGVDFTYPFLIEDVAILKSKGLPEIDPWGFLLPLAPSVWAALLAALVAVWLAVVVLGNQRGVSEQVNFASELLFQHVRIFFRQDMNLDLLYARERLVVGGWLLVAMMVTWSYSGNLVSLLAVRHIPQPIQTIRDLLDDSSLTVILQPNTILTDLLFNIESGDLKALGDLKNVGRMRYVYASAYAKAVNTLVHSGDHVLLTTRLSLDRYVADFYSKTGKCDFYKARETLVSITLCWVSQKGSPVTAALNHRILSLVEAGLYNYWVLNNIPYLRNCRFTPSKITVREPLAINNLWGMLVLLGAGHLLALATFCWELYFAKLARTGDL